MKPNKSVCSECVHYNYVLGCPFYITDLADCDIAQEIMEEREFEVGEK
jgi:tRNA G26 N,N-dimethylase Trm1